MAGLAAVLPPVAFVAVDGVWVTPSDTQPAVFSVVDSVGVFGVAVFKDDEAFVVTVVVVLLDLAVGVFWDVLVDVLVVVLDG